MKNLSQLIISNEGRVSESLEELGSSFPLSSVAGEGEVKQMSLCWPS